MPQTQFSAVIGHIRELAALSAQETSDAQLLERFRAQRDETAFSALVRRHGRMVLGVCRHVLRQREDAEDAFQATFLVLARNAAAIRKEAALPSWLYGVAYRVASNARREACRRQAHERKAVKVAHAQADLDLAWKELQAVLAEEVQRLPEKYRSPFLLCCLEGKSKSEAAAQLGWKEGTVSGRLAKARQRMQQRLARRGLTLSAALCASTLSAGDALALTPALVHTTVRAALGAAPGATMSLVSTPVAALAEGTMKAMFASKVRAVTALLVVCGLLAVGAGVQLRRSPAAPRASEFNLAPRAAAFVPDAQQADGPHGPPGSSRRIVAAQPLAPKPPADSADKVEVTGVVLGPDGKPFPGAELLVAPPRWGEPGLARPDVRARSDAEGRFRLGLSRSEFVRNTNLIAFARDHGPGWLDIGKAPEGPLTLKLVPDAPITGRIIDLQGLPVEDVVVTVLRVTTTPAEDLTPIFKAWPEHSDRAMQLLDKRLYQPAWVGVSGPVKTDAVGRFRITGVGRERLAVLKLNGPTIEHKALYVFTRPGADIAALTRPDSEKNMPGMPRHTRPTVYGLSFQHPAQPTRPVVGIVRDKGTGKPIAGATVNGNATNQWWEDYVTTATDSQGRFRLVGLPKADGYRISALARGGRTYLPAAQALKDSEGLEPLTANFELVHGVLVRGRVTDKETGKPVESAIFYRPLADNKFFRDLPGKDWYRYMTESLRTDKDGNFSLRALPGSGLIRVRAEYEAMGRYAEAVLDPAHKDKIYREDTGLGVTFLSVGGAIEALEGHHAYQLIDPDQSLDTLTCNFALGRGQARTGTVVGPDGKPLAGATAVGLVAVGGGPTLLADASFTATGLNPAHPRLLAFVHKERKLVGHVTLRGDEGTPVRVPMQPWGVVFGRALDEDGNPLAGAEVSIFYEKNSIRWLFEARRSRIKTDAAGRFRVEGLFPGFTFGLNFTKKGQFRNPGDNYRSLSIKPGQTHDLGDVRTKLFPAD